MYHLTFNLTIHTTALIAVGIVVGLLANIQPVVGQIHATDTLKGYTKSIGGVAQVLPATRQYKQLRFEEDYSYLADISLRNDYLDILKYIQLSKNKNWYLSLGGEARLFFEHYTNEAWGTVIKGDNSYFMQRYMLHADAKLGKRLRVFVQLKSGFQNGRRGGPRPVDVDKLDLNQAFIDFHLIEPALQVGRQFISTAMLRIGRQELDFGAGRMISVRELPNIRQSYDGFRSTIAAAHWTLDALAVRPAQTNRGVFDDRTDRNQALWGLYGVYHFSNGLNLDVYYLGNSRKRAVFHTGTGEEERHSVGHRLWYNQHRWTWDAEGTYQAGSFGEGKIRAWAFSSRATYAFPRMALQPKISLNMGINSGSRSNGDTGNQTFHPPAVNGAYFGAVGALGPENVAGFAPKLSLSPVKTLFIDAYCYFYWRQSTGDGLYNVPGFPVKPGTGSRAAYIGTQPEVDVVWQMAPHQSLVLVYANFFAGRFIRETPPDHQITYGALWYTFKF